MIFEEQRKLDQCFLERNYDTVIIVALWLILGKQLKIDHYFVKNYDIDNYNNIMILILCLWFLYLFNFKK